MIFFLRCLFSVMVSEPVLPSPPSDRGLLGDEKVNAIRFLEFLRRGGRCGITTVTVVAVGAHDGRSEAALVYACASPLALAHAIGFSRAPPSTLTAVAGGGAMVWGERRLSWRGSWGDLRSSGRRARSISRRAPSTITDGGG